MLEIEPFGDQVVIRPQETSSVTDGGIHLIEDSAEKPTQGKVVAVGPGAWGPQGERLRPAVARGDVVIYSKYAGTDIKVNDEELVILREKDVLCAVRGVEAKVSAGA